MRGFTLIELSIVLVVLGLVMGVVIVVQDLTHPKPPGVYKELTNDCNDRFTR